MSAKELGIPFDIHCGGIDHIAVHHTNEIVQAEAAYEKPLARFWLHGEFLILKKGRMGKSEGNIITLNDLIEKEINPLAYRYLCLTAHYRSPLTFSLKNLRAAENALKKLYKITAELKACPDKKAIISRKAKGYQKQFLKDINNDLAMPQAIALVWTMLDDEKLNKAEKYALLVDWDKVLGLGLETIKEMEIPKTVVDLVEKREKMRTDKDWSGADKVRKKIEKAGYTVRDTKKGPEIKCNF
jgi:cysteinyl-tRNA synthetase